jgi:exosortase
VNDVAKESIGAASSVVAKAGDDLSASQQRRGTFLALAPSWVAVAWLISKAQWVWTNRPEMQFGWIVVLLSAYLFWENWPPRFRPVFRGTLLNVISAAAGLALLGLIQVYQAAFGTNAASLCGHALGTLIVAGANLHFVFGWAGLRTFGFPFLFLLVAMPMPSAIQGPVTHALQGLVASLNVEVLNLVGIPAQRVGNLIHLPNGTVGINEACSGIRSLQSSIMATLFIGYLTLRSNGLRSILFVGGMLTAVVGNIFRSLYLSLTANARGVEAVDQVHDAAGWSILAFTAVGVALLAWFLARIERSLAAARELRAGAQ